MPHDPGSLEDAWDRLVDHTKRAATELVVLPEMPFPKRWEASVTAHETWLTRLGELAASTVIGSRPVLIDGHRRNEAFVWESGSYSASHHKYYLPDEEGFWEATWYERGAVPIYPVLSSTHADVGVMICTEMWFTEHARALGRDGVTILATPRATEWSTRDRWLMGGQAAAVMAGAFGLSSNHSGTDADEMRWGGYGWVIDPNGTVLATTSEDEPCVTVTIELAAATDAKATYPRYVAE
jgi:N-carbamoylputrescine amidase